MKYIEDYVSEELLDEIELELKKIYDNEEFILCSFSSLNNDNEAHKLLDFLKTNDISREERYKVIMFLLDMENSRFDN